MKLYDEVIQSWYGLMQGHAAEKLVVSTDEDRWEDVGKNNVILRGDMAYELGGGTLPAIGGVALTDSKELVPEDAVYRIGPDLHEITEDTCYARLAVIRVKSEAMGEGDTLYNAIRKIEYTKYHMNPKGFMLRISAANERETARVAKAAIEEGMDFAKIGRCFIESYHENPNVEAVQLYFITEKDFPYKDLIAQVHTATQITATVDHIFKNLIMDCKACNLKEICDEVEGMKELHFGQMAKSGEQMKEL